MLDETELSTIYDVRKLTSCDMEIIYRLCYKNKIFYDHHPPMVTYDSIRDDLEALPPGKTLDDKYFIGFFHKGSLMAVMDLISGYPQDDVVYIGFFMMDIAIQNKGIGSNIISECIYYLKKCGFKKIRLGVDQGNPQSFHFWIKNGFCVDSYKDKYIVMEREM